MGLGIRVDPYNDIAESVATSQIVAVYDAQAWTYEWRLGSGSNSTVTCQVSDAAELVGSTFAESMWSNHNASITGGTFLAEGPNPVRFVRFIRTPSAGSLVADVNKYTFGP